MLQLQLQDASKIVPDASKIANSPQMGGAPQSYIFKHGEYILKGVNISL